MFAIFCSVRLFARIYDSALVYKSVIFIWRAKTWNFAGFFFQLGSIRIELHGGCLHFAALNFFNV